MIVEKNRTNAIRSAALGRREFLRTSGAVLAGGAALAGGAGGLAAAEPEADAVGPQKAVLRLCSQEWIVPGRSVREKAEKILRWGGCGLEFGLKDVGRAEQIRKDLEGTGVSPAAICWTSHHGDFVAADPARRKKAMDDLKQALETAAALVRERRRLDPLLQQRKQADARRDGQSPR